MRDVLNRVSDVAQGAEPGAEPGVELGAVAGAEPVSNRGRTGVCVVPPYPCGATALRIGRDTNCGLYPRTYVNPHRSPGLSASDQVAAATIVRYYDTTLAKPARRTATHVYAVTRRPLALAVQVFPSPGVSDATSARPRGRRPSNPPRRRSRDFTRSFRPQEALDASALLSGIRFHLTPSHKWSHNTLAKAARRARWTAASTGPAKGKHHVQA